MGRIATILAGEKLLGAGRGSLSEFAIDAGGLEFCSQVGRDDGGWWTIQAGGEVRYERVAEIRAFDGHGGKKDILGGAGPPPYWIRGVLTPLPHGAQSDA